MDTVVKTLDNELYQVEYNKFKDISKINRDHSIYLKENPISDIDIVEVIDTNDDKKNLKSNYIIDKNASISLLMEEIDLYCDIYQLPPINISQKEWNILFNTIYEMTREIKREKDYYKFLNIINNYTLAEALVENSEIIILEDYVKSLNYLKKYNISDQIIEKTANKITKYIDKNKIIVLKRTF